MEEEQENFCQQGTLIVSESNFGTEESIIQ